MSAAADALPPLRAETASVEETRAVGSALAHVLRAGDVVALSGDLGAGKTAFVQGVAAGLGSSDRVVSPTFTLVRQYRGRIPIVHIDVYRLDRVQDVLDLGFEDLLDPEGVVLVEWGDMIEGILPLDHLLVRIVFPDDERPDLRRIDLEAYGQSWQRRWSDLRARLAEPAR